MKKLLWLLALLASTAWADTAGLRITQNQIVISMICSENGPAPKLILCDASGTTSTQTQYPFHDIQYSWDFGDPSSGTWGDQTTGSAGAEGNTNRNLAQGPIAAHVYGASGSGGTFTITLTARDSLGNTASQTRTVSVTSSDAQWPTTSTTCVSSNTTPVAGSDGCPVGASVAMQSNFVTLMAAYATNGRRVLLKGGDVFTEAASVNLTATGPGLLGSYGTGKAVIRTTSADTYAEIINLSSLNDWRIVDLEFDGQSTKTNANAISGGGINKILMLRLYIHDIGGGIELGLNTSGAPTEIGLVDSSIQRLMSINSSTHGLLGMFHKFAIMGNLFDDSTANSAEHLLRFPYLNTGLISYNRVQYSHATKELIAIRAPCYYGASLCTSNTNYSANGLVGHMAVTKKVVVSDNYGVNTTYAGIETGASNTTDNVRLEDLIFERNYLKSISGGTLISVGPGANRFTIRNNLLDTTLGIWSNIAVATGSANTSPAPDMTWIYNNTVFDNSSASSITGFRIRTNSTNTVVKNNLMYAPNGTSTLPVTILDSGSGTISLGNSTNTQTRSVNPSFTTLPPTAVTHFKPTGASYAIGSNNACTGAPCSTSVGIPVWSDFFMVVEPAVRDIGAVIH